MVEVLDEVISILPEKERFYSELEQMQIKTVNIPNNLQAFHEALKSAFGKDHYSIESLIIKTLHVDTKKGIYSEKDASQVAIRLLDVFTKEHQKEIDQTKKQLSKPKINNSSLVSSMPNHRFIKNINAQQRRYKSD
jgi:hypothetical protein